jgi:magnesium-transporting ATPase (P-type)
LRALSLSRSETNLKIKQAVPDTYNIACSSSGLDYPLYLPSLVIENTAPNKGLDASAWKGNVTFYSYVLSLSLSFPPPLALFLLLSLLVCWFGFLMLLLFFLSSSRGEKLALSMDQLLLRGCTLRNTKWVVGFVIFTGTQTKVMLNYRSASFKRSNVDRIVDRALYVLFSLQALLCSFGAGLQYYWTVHSSLLSLFFFFVSRPVCTCTCLLLTSLSSSLSPE